MTGISEILVLILLICGILILPRMFKPAPAPSKTQKAPSKFASMKMRAGIVASILYPVILALFLKPWQGNHTLYISLGILPVILAWAIIWILAAQKK